MKESGWTRVEYWEKDDYRVIKNSYGLYSVELTPWLGAGRKLLTDNCRTWAEAKRYVETLIEKDKANEPE